MSKSINKISASIVLYNTDTTILEDSISSFLNSELTGSLWIIDNSDDALYQYLENSHKSIKYIKSDGNLGYGKAHNIALNYFLNKTEYHLVLNPDVSFSDKVITELIDYLDSNINIGLIAPKAVYPDGTQQSNGRLIPSPTHLFLRRFFLINKFNFKRNTDYELKNNRNRNYSAPVVLGSFMLFRNSSLKDIGLFDERFFLYPEDIDISRRMFAKYDNIIYSNQSFTHHHSRESYKSIKLLLTHIKEMIKYFNKWGWFNDRLRGELNDKALKGK